MGFMDKVFNKNVTKDVTKDVAQEAMKNQTPEGVEKTDLYAKAKELTYKNIAGRGNDPYFKKLKSDPEALEKHIQALAKTLGAEGVAAKTEEYAESSKGTKGGFND